MFCVMLLRQIFGNGSHDILLLQETEKKRKQKEEAKRKQDEERVQNSVLKLIILVQSLFFIFCPINHQKAAVYLFHVS